MAVLISNLSKLLHDESFNPSSQPEQNMEPDPFYEIAMNKYKLWCDAGSKGNPGYCYGSYLITGDNNFSQTLFKARCRNELALYCEG